MRKLMLLVLALAMVVSIQAQQRTGDIYGKVTDPEGAPLPGVTVVLTGTLVSKIEAVTNEQGIFRFRSLSPASDYVVNAELEGFKKGIRTGIQVLVGGNTEVNFQMQLGVLTEEVIVQASAPVVNTRSTSVSQVVTRQELQSLPTGRDPFIILAMAPGIQTDRENMAGSESGQQASSVGRGAGSYDNNIWNVDGINVTDPAAIGATPTYWDFDAFEEMNVTVGGADVTTQTGGVTLNMVTRRGGNRHSLGGRFYVTDSAFQGDNLTDEITTGGVNAIVGIRNIKDFGFNIGGPIIKNKAYYWMSYGVQDIKTKTVTGANDDTLLTNYAFKINIQPIEANRFEAFLHAGGKTKEGRDASASYPQGRGQGGQYHFGSPILKFQDEHTFGNNLFLSLKWALSDAGFKLWPMNDPDGTHLLRYDRTADLYTGSWFFYDVQRPKYNYSANLTYFNDKLLGGSHEVMLGGEYTKFKQEVFSACPGALYLYTNWASAELDLNGDGTDDIPGSEWSQIYTNRPTKLSQLNTQYSAYIQDNMTYGNFMIKAGARFDKYAPYVDPMNIDPIDPTVPAFSELFEDAAITKLDQLFPAATAPLTKPKDWEMTVISPRLGITWDIKGDGKNILKLAYNRTGDVMGTISNFANFGTGGYMNFWWNDVNANGQASLNELYWWQLVNEGKAPVRAFDDAGNFVGDYATMQNQMWGGFTWGSGETFPTHTLLDGQYKTSWTNEILLTFEKEFSRDLAVSLGGTYRTFTNLQSTYRLLHDSMTVIDGNMFSQVGNLVIPNSIPTTVDEKWGNPWGTIDTGEAAGLPIYNINAGVPTTDWNMRKTIDGLTRSFWGIDLILTKRLSHKWMANFSATYQGQASHYDDPNAYANVHPNTASNPTNLWSLNDQPYAPNVGGASGKIGQNVFSRWMLKGSLLYQLPWDINVSAVMTAHEGNLLFRNVTLRVDDSPNALYSKNITTNIETFGTTRTPSMLDLTLRAEKMIRIGENQTVYIMFDLFNAFNSNTIDRQYNFTYGTYNVKTGAWTDSVANSGRIGGILNPRVFRLGVRFQF